MASSEIRTGRPPRTSVWLAERPAPKRRTVQTAQSDRDQPAGRLTGQQAGQQAGLPADRPADRPAGRKAGDGQPLDQQQDGLDRDKITAASVRLLDADGLAKFSMRRLAAELGVTAMSVYWYVQSKDDLLELALDAVEGEVALPDPDDMATDWPDQLRQLAYGYRQMFNDHPWASRMIGSCLNVGPRAMAFADATRRIMEHSGLPAHQLVGGLSALFQFVFGFSTVEAHWNSRCREAGLATDEYHAAVQAKIQGRPEYAESPQLMGERGGETVDGMRQRDFAVALDCIIAGIETLRDRADAPAQPAGPAQ